MQELTDQVNRIDMVLDKGFVKLVDYMGSDAAIVQAARVSYGEGTKTIREDRGLIRYLLRQGHSSPFEMVQTKWHIKTPIFVARQWLRHRTASVNELSRRYSEATDEFYIPEDSRIQSQSTNNKQGSGEELSSDIKDIFYDELDNVYTTTFNSYDKLNKLGVARELGRITLPVSLYTEFYWSMNLRNLFHFLKLRLDNHAQYEIRVYAEAIYKRIKELFPLACEAFDDYIVGGKTFSKQEMGILRQLIDASMLPELESSNLLTVLSTGERQEFLSKLISF